MSGYRKDAVIRQTDLDGAIAFLHKPFTSATLIETIRKVLDS